LKNSLERLTHLTLPDEVLIIDDGGSDNCKEVVESFKDRLPIRYIYNHNPDWSICSMARNIGIKNTECEIIITAEPEILFVTDVIKQMLDLHQEIPNKVISAGTVYHQGYASIIGQDMINDPSDRLNNASSITESAHNTNPANPIGYAKIKGWVAPFSALYRKEWLIEINGWDESFIQWGFDDTDLLTRLRLNNIGQDIALGIEVIHQYHDKLPPDVQFRAVQQNEKLMNVKNFDIDNPNNDIITNKNCEWGIIKER